MTTDQKQLIMAQAYKNTEGYSHDEHAVYLMAVKEALIDRLKQASSELHYEANRLTKQLDVVKSQAKYTDSKIIELCAS